MLATQTGVGAKHELLARMSEARRQSDSLFNVVRVDALYDRPIPERNRIIFYLGHLEAFDWNLLHDRSLGLKSFYPDFDRLFAFGIDPVGGGLPQDQPSDWPSLEIVRDYASRIRAAIDEKLLDGRSESEGRDGFSLATLLNVSIEHRLMHVETLAYMLHQLPLDRKVPQDCCSSEPSNFPVYHRMIEIPAGPATLGLSRDSETFGWDNEYELRTTEVPAFEIDQYKVTNAQYLDFIAAGGYQKRDFWNDADWNWRVANAISHPLFWKKLNGEWLYWTMFDEIPLPLDWPVYVSHAEASAYARWAGKSLPTEQQWHRAAFGSTNETSRLYPWGGAPPDAHFGNFDLQRWDPTPVNAFPAGKSAFGVSDMLGNGWEWTSTIFGPFPGFEAFPFYRGYSADFFDGKHFVMKGASARTAACMLRPSFRNWFQPHYQYVYAGFRCVSRQS
jgi:gamma-glutamyl hercynylcysteine S-oxide synthase